MGSSLFLLILLQVALIASNAVFACLEIAVISMNDRRLERLAKTGNRRARRLARLTEQPARFLATIQVAITLSGFLGSAFAAENFSEYLAVPLQGWLGGSMTMWNSISIVLITLLLSYVTLVFGELVPKRLAMRKAEPLALGMSGLVCAIARLCAPVVWLLTVSTNAVLRLLGIDPTKEDDAISEEEIRMTVDVGCEKGAIDTEERAFIQNVFEFDDLTADEIATHRTDVAALWLEDGDETWARTIHESRHSRYPVCDGSLDKVVGVLIAKDWFRLERRDRAAVLAQAVRPPVFVPEGVKADVLFRDMKRRHNPFAIVCDEYGGMSGVITMSDLVERLVGETPDEDSAAGEPPPDVEKVGPDVWRVQGSAPLDEVAQALGVPIDAEDCDTFGGFLLAQLGAIPADGAAATVKTERLSVEIPEVRDKRVPLALVTVLPAPQPEDGEDAAE